MPDADAPQPRRLSRRRRLLFALVPAAGLLLFAELSIRLFRAPLHFGSFRELRVDMLRRGYPSTPHPTLGYAPRPNFRGDDNEGYASGWDHDVVRRTNLAPLADDNSDGGGRFGGLHPGGFNGVLGDGSVRFIKFSIQCCGSGTTFFRLGHKSDGGVLGSDF